MDKSTYLLGIAAILIGGCAGSRGGDVKQGINAQGATVQGSITQSVGTSGAGGNTTQTNEVRLALDPSTFSTVFGSAALETAKAIGATPRKVTANELDATQRVAQQLPAEQQVDLLKLIKKCREALESCVAVVAKP